MTEKIPKGQETFTEIGQDIKLWVSKNNWVYWALAIGGIVGLILVAWYLLRKKPQGDTKA